MVGAAVSLLAWGVGRWTRVQIIACLHGEKVSCSAHAVRAAAGLLT
jgi:hypothetical protein